MQNLVWIKLIFLSSKSLHCIVTQEKHSNQERSRCLYTGIPLSPPCCLFIYEQCYVKVLNSILLSETIFINCFPLSTCWNNHQEACRWCARWHTGNTHQQMEVIIQTDTPTAAVAQGSCFPQKAVWQSLAQLWSLFGSVCQSRSRNLFPASLAFLQLYSHLIILALRSMTDVPCRVFCRSSSSMSPSLSSLFLVKPLSDVDTLTLRMFMAMSSERAEKFSLPSDSMTSPWSPQYLKKASKSAKFFEYLELMSEWERLTPLPDRCSVSGAANRPPRFLKTAVGLSVAAERHFVAHSCSVSAPPPFLPGRGLSVWRSDSFPVPWGVAILSRLLKSATSCNGAFLWTEPRSSLRVMWCLRSFAGPRSNSHLCL